MASFYSISGKYKCCVTRICNAYCTVSLASYDDKELSHFFFVYNPHYDYNIFIKDIENIVKIIINKYTDFHYIECTHIRFNLGSYIENILRSGYGIYL